MQRTTRVRIGALALVMLAIACAGVLRHEIHVSRQQLQDKVEGRFPVQRRQSLVTMRFTEPRILLQPGSDRIGLSLSVRVELPGGHSVQGSLRADGALTYAAPTGEIRIARTRVRDLEIEGLSRRVTGLLEKAAAAVLARRFERITVYRLQGGDVKASLARLVLKSVEVRDGEVVAVVGL